MVIDIETLEHMIHAGDEQVRELEAKQHDLDNAIAACEATLDALQQASSTRAQHIEQARARLERAETEHAQKAGYAKLAHGTLHEQQSIKETSAAKKAMDTARRELERLEQEHAEAEKQERASMQEQQTQLHLLHAEKETRQAEQQSVQAGRDKAYAELGELKHEQYVQGYQERQKRIDALKGQLILAQVDAQAYYEQALLEMATWDVLQKDLQRLQQKEDSTSRALASTLSHIETLLREVACLPENLPQDFKRRGFSLWESILVYPDEILLARRYPHQLRQRQERLRHLLHDYRAYLASL